MWMYLSCTNYDNLILLNHLCLLLLKNCYFLKKKLYFYEILIVDYYLLWQYFSTFSMLKTTQWYTKKMLLNKIIEVNHC